jgi:hypothetical protein
LKIASHQHIGAQLKEVVLQEAQSDTEMMITTLEVMIHDVLKSTTRTAHQIIDVVNALMKI